MTDNTAVKKTTVRKRPKKERSTFEFDAFVRRCLKAYAARVATGDIEALRTLATLTEEVDATITLAVIGLREHHYSWEAIGEALGMSRQGAQQRYGDRTERHRLDQRLIEAGLTVTVYTLAAVFADHHPGIPSEGNLCPGCGFRYSKTVMECPSMAVARPLLKKRYTEDSVAVAKRLGPELFPELQGKTTEHQRVVKAAQSAKPAASTSRTSTAPTLFDPNRKG